MKKSIFITVALFAFTSFTNQLFAQDAVLKTRTKSNQTNEKSSGNVTAVDDWQQQNAKVATGKHFPKATLSCRVVATDDGCSIVFENEIVSPRDAASGLPTGKRMHKPFSFVVSSSDNSVSEVKSPRDAATGQSSGKRMTKSTTVFSTTSSADAAISNSSGGGAGKASFKEFTVTKRCGGKATKISCDGGECEIPLDDCPNGDCALTADWSWGATNTGSSGIGGGSGSGRCSVDFLLQIEDGACTAMAINEKGLPGEKGPAKKVK